jgi:hypothetical protein
MVLRFSNAQAFGHLVVQEAFPVPVRLYPFPVNDKLGDSAFAGPRDNLVGGAGRGLNVYISIRDLVFLQEALGGPAVWAPKGGIDEYFHRLLSFSLRPLRFFFAFSAVKSSKSL